MRSANRPQFDFKTPIDNRANVPFKPRIKHKPHSMVPLRLNPERNAEGIIVGYSHPYEHELNEFTPSAQQLTFGVVVKPGGMAYTPLKFIQTIEDLHELLNDLRVCTEMAVDLEHHSYRSFQGFTCLMQISTRQKDYIVDTLALREELHILNEVFTDSSILKVYLINKYIHNIRTIKI